MRKEASGKFSACLILRTIQPDVKLFETRSKPNFEDNKNPKPDSLGFYWRVQVLVKRVTGAAENILDFMLDEFLHLRASRA